MRKRTLLSAVIAATVAAQSSVHAATLEQLEERIISLEKSEKRAKLQVRALKGELDERDSRFRINGFMNVGAATLDSDTGEGSFHFIDDEVSWENDTQLGLQMAMKVNDRAEIITQLMARASGQRDIETFDTRNEWAFVKYRLSDDVTLRAGRLRTPWFNLSEYLEVGYAYPWVRPPQEVYVGSVNAYNGIDLIHTSRISGVNLTSEIYGGSYKSVTNFAPFFSLDKMIGGRFSANYGAFTATVGYGRGRGNAEFSGEVGALSDALQRLAGEGLFAEDAAANFGSVGFTYDDGTWLVMAEMIRQRIEGVYADEEANYVSVARRFGDLQPYVYHSTFYTTDDALRRDLVEQIVTPTASLIESQLAAPRQSALLLQQRVATLTAGYSAALAAAQTAAMTFGPTSPEYAAAAQAVASAAADLAEETILLTGLNASIAEGEAMLADVQSVGDAVNSLTAEQKSFAAGLRWDFSSNMSMKFEIQHIYDAFGRARLSADAGEEANVYSVALNAVF